MRLAIALGVLLVGATSANAAGFGQLQKWGGFGTGDSEFTLPTFIEVNRSNGQVFVADQDPNGVPNTFRIQRFNNDGQFAGAFAQQTGDPSFDFFFQAFGGMAVDPARDVLYLTRPVDEGVDPSAPSFVERYRLSTGEKLSNFSDDANFNGSGGLLSPTAITVDSSDGSVWIAGKNGSNVIQVQKFSAAGTPGTRFGQNGTQAGRFFAQIRALEMAPNGQLVIADVDPTTQFAGRIQRFGQDGTFVSGSDITSSADHPFFANDLGVDTRGNIYVDHAIRGNVGGGSVTGGGLMKFSPQGVELKRWGAQAAAPANGACEFGGARLHLAVDADRDVFVADAGRPLNTVRQIHKYGPNGTGCGDFREVSIGNVEVDEGNSGNTAATFAVSLAGGAAPAGGVKVDFATANGTAGSGDYTAANGTAEIPEGQTSTQVTVQVTGDTAVEPNETFEVRLSNPRGGDIDDDTGVGTIKNDDQQAPPPPPSCDAIQRLVDTVMRLLGQPGRC